jgi:vancomycin resistance protein YoaR
MTDLEDRQAESAAQAGSPDVSHTMNRHYRLALVGAVIAGLLLLPLVVFAVAEALNQGEIAPGVSAAGVPIGGLSPEDALEAMQLHERALRETPVPFLVQETDVELDPRVVALDLDAEAAVDLAVTARRNGGFFDRFAAWARSFTSTVDVPTDITWDDDALEGVFESWEQTAIGEPANEGAIEVVDGVVQPVYPVAGVGLDRAEARRLVAEAIVVAERTRQEISTAPLIPRVTDADVDAAVIEGTRMIDSPVTLTAEDPDLAVEFDVDLLAANLVSDVPEGEPARIVLGFDEEGLAEFLDPRREEIERPPRDARFLVQSDGTVALQESRRGMLLDVQLVAEALAVASGGSDRGAFPFAQGDRPEFTTAEAEAMGPISQVSFFATDYSCCEPRVTNIQTIAAAVTDTIVWPGETFSLNDLVGPRTEEKGYVLAPQILQGEFVDAVGGGVSQFATTFYNAIFFGCYEIVEHTPHSFYFPRYPEGREATISWPSPDVVFRNDSDALILIKSYASDNRVSVAFYGNNGGKDCTSERSDRRDPTEYTTVYEEDPTLSPTAEVVDTYGSDGWTVDVTRIITLPDGESASETWTHTYLPIPTIIRVHPCNMPESSEECPVQVPTVVGLTFSEAQARLADAGLTIGDGGTVPVDSSGQDGLVQSQSISSGEYVARGTAVTVEVGSYTAPPTTEPPADDSSTTTGPP